MSNKPSLYNATKHLTELMDKVENCDDLNQELIDDFCNAKSNISEAIDRRKYAMAECNSRIDSAKNMITDIKDHVAKLEKIKDRIKSSTLFAMSLDDGINYKDSLGRSLKIRKAPPKLNIDLNVKKISIDNCIDNDTANREDVINYVNKVTYNVLDVYKIKEEIKNNVSINWASITIKDYLHGL